MVSQDCVISLQPGQQEQNSVSEKKKSTSFFPGVIIVHKAIAIWCDDLAFIALVDICLSLVWLGAEIHAL